MGQQSFSDTDERRVVPYSPLREYLTENSRESISPVPSANNIEGSGLSGTAAQTRGPELDSDQLRELISFFTSGGNTNEDPSEVNINKDNKPKTDETIRGLDPYSISDDPRMSDIGDLGKYFLYTLLTGEKIDPATWLKHSRGYEGYVSPEDKAAQEADAERKRGLEDAREKRELEKHDAFLRRQELDNQQRELRNQKLLNYLTGNDEEEPIEGGREEDVLEQILNPIVEEEESTEIPVELEQEILEDILDDTAPPEDEGDDDDGTNPPEDPIDPDPDIPPTTPIDGGDEEEEESNNPLPPPPPATEGAGPTPNPLRRNKSGGDEVDTEGLNERERAIEEYFNRNPEEVEEEEDPIEEGLIGMSPLEEEEEEEGYDPPTLPEDPSLVEEPKEPSSEPSPRRRLSRHASEVVTEGNLDLERIKEYFNKLGTDVQEEESSILPPPPPATEGTGPTPNPIQKRITEQIANKGEKVLGKPEPEPTQPWEDPKSNAKVNVDEKATQLREAAKDRPTTEGAVAGVQETNPIRQTSPTMEGSAQQKIEEKKQTAQRMRELEQKQRDMQKVASKEPNLATNLGMRKVEQEQEEMVNENPTLFTRYKKAVDEWEKNRGNPDLPDSEWKKYRNTPKLLARELSKQRGWSPQEIERQLKEEQ